jgi:hypothetical protein
VDSGLWPRRIATYTASAGGRYNTTTVSGNNHISTIYYVNPSDLVYDKIIHNYLTGAHVSTSSANACDVTSWGSRPRWYSCHGGNTNYVVCYDSGSSGHNFWYQDATEILEINTHPIGGVTDYSRSVMHHIMYMNGAFYAFYERFGSGDPIGIAKWDGTGEVPTNTVLASYQLGTYASNAILTGSNLGIGVDNENNYVYVASTGGSGATDTILWEFDTSLTLLRTWQRQDLPTIWQNSIVSRAFGRWNGYMWMKCDSIGARKIYAFTIAKPFSNTEIGYTTEAGTATQEAQHGNYILGADGSKGLGQQYTEIVGGGMAGTSTFTGVGVAVVDNGAGSFTGTSSFTATSEAVTESVGTFTGTSTLTSTGFATPYGEFTGTSTWTAVGVGTTNPLAWTAYSHLAPICDVCGFRYPSEVMRRRWDGLWVCPSDYETRHIADFIRTRREAHRAKPWIRPEFVYPDSNLIRRVTLNTTTASVSDASADFSVTLEDFMLPMITSVKIYVNSILVATATNPTSTATTVSTTVTMASLGISAGSETAYATITLNSGAVLTGADVTMTLTA